MRRLNLICRDAAQIVNESKFRKRPDKPFGRIKLPRLYAIAVVVLKFVVIVVITFAHGEEGKEERIARATFRRIRLPADGVTCAVN